MYQRILVPIDGSATSNCGLDESIRLAKLTGGRIRLVHVVDTLILSTGLAITTGDILGMLMDAGAQILSEARARVEASGVAVDTLLPETGSGVCYIVIEQAKLWPADLIVIGTHGRRGVRRLFIGSDAEQIVRAAPVPVLLVRMREGKVGVPSAVGSGADAAVPRTALAA